MECIASVAGWPAAAVTGATAIEAGGAHGPDEVEAGQDGGEHDCYEEEGVSLAKRDDKHERQVGGEARAGMAASASHTLPLDSAPLDLAAEWDNVGQRSLVDLGEGRLTGGPDFGGLVLVCIEVDSCK